MIKEQKEFKDWREEIGYIQSMIDLERGWNDEERERGSHTPPHRF